MIDDKYIFEIDVEGFEKISEDKYICKCPICKEGHAKRKKRFCILRAKDGNWVVSCRNCGYNHSFTVFLKEYYPDVFDKYNMERIFYNTDHAPVKHLQEVNSMASGLSFGNILEFVSKVIDLQPGHPALGYVMRRKLPEAFLHELRFTDNLSNYCTTIAKLYPGVIDFEFQRLTFPALIIPIYDKYNRLVYIQARNLLKGDIRFITIKLDPKAKKIWGLNKVDYDKQIYVFEGVFDAVFLNNSLAMLGSSVSDLANDVDDKSKVTFIMDNEFNVREINQICERIIAAGYKLLFWTRDNRFKDLNDMIINDYFGINYECLVYQYIENNTLSGFQATMELKMRLNA